MSLSANQDPGLPTIDQSPPLMILTLICLLDPPSIQVITRTQNVHNTNWQMDATLLMIKHRDNLGTFPFDDADAVFLSPLIFADNSDEVSDATLGGNIVIPAFILFQF